MKPQNHPPAPGASITSAESSDGSVVVSVHGQFDDALACDLGSLLAGADPDSHVIVDLADARDFPEFAVATLARIVEGAAGTVSLVGLGRQHCRILRHFGIQDCDGTMTRRAPRRSPHAARAALHRN